MRTDWKQLETIIDPANLLRIAGEISGSIYLKSNTGRFDIFSSMPERVISLNKNSLPAAQKLLQEARQIYKKLIPVTGLVPVPFISGLMGYVGYDAATSTHGLTVKTTINSALPAAFIGHYTWSYVYDHQLQRGYITFSPLCAESVRTEVLAMLSAPLDKTDTSATASAPHWQAMISFDDYRKRFIQAKRYIEEGDAYQINLAQAFRAEFQGRPSSLFESLNQRIQTPYSAFINPGQRSSILSFSPEQFIAVQGRRVLTRPIKGTLRNSGDPSEALTLANSPKNRAENVMIVDLMRNDLSRVCTNFSIRVPSLCKVETYRNVHHLVSTVEGELRNDCDALAAFFACLPGGSITGAPKHRAMQIIAELEPCERDAYCGSAFYFSGDGTFDSNILIRTIVQSDHQLFCWGGGGIVADSILEQEYAESLIKVQNLTGIASPFS